MKFVSFENGQFLCFIHCILCDLILGTKCSSFTFASAICTVYFLVRAKMSDADDNRKSIVAEVPGIGFQVNIGNSSIGSC